MISLSRWLGGVGIVTLLCLSGCGGQAGPKTAAVAGKVTAGGEPFKEGLVRFIPKPGQNLNSREATTDANGNYKIMFNNKQPGLEPGEYVVMFSLWQLPDGNPLPEQPDPDFPKAPHQLGGVQWVAPEFATGAAPQCAITVTDSANTFDFELPELKAPAGK